MLSLVSRAELTRGEGRRGRRGGGGGGVVYVQGKRSEATGRSEAKGRRMVLYRGAMPCGVWREGV